MNQRGVIAMILMVMFFMVAWIIFAEYRIEGLEIRMNLQEASQHWQETPPEVQR